MKVFILALLAVIVATSCAQEPQISILTGEEINTSTPKCGFDERYLSCGPNCDKYCDERPCLLVYVKCPPGCYCKEGYKRNIANTCIPENECHPGQNVN